MKFDIVCVSPTFNSTTDVFHSKIDAYCCGIVAILVIQIDISTKTVQKPLFSHFLPVEMHNNLAKKDTHKHYFLTERSPAEMHCHETRFQSSWSTRDKGIPNDWNIIRSTHGLYVVLRPFAQRPHHNWNHPKQSQILSRTSHKRHVLMRVLCMCRYCIENNST